MIPYPKFGRSKQSGFIKTVIAILCGIILLKYVLHVDILSYFQNGKINPYFDKAYSGVERLWEIYIHPAVNVAIKYALVVWAFFLKYWMILWNRAVVIGSKFLHTVPS